MKEKMRRLAGLLAISCCTLLPSAAQNYESLWKQVEKASKSDAPRTAMSALDRIRTQATADGNAGQCLKALLVRYRFVTSLSPDSTTAAIDLLRTGLRNEKDEAARSLYHTVLGRLLLEKTPAYTDDPQSDSVRLNAQAHFSQALGNPQLLADVQASRYVPLIVTGRDSRHYAGDLLSVVASSIRDGYRLMRSDTASLQARRDVSHLLLDTYRRRGNASAVLLATLDSLRDVSTGSLHPDRPAEQPVYRFYRNLLHTYAENPLVIEGYIELCYQLVGETSDSLRLALANEGIALHPQYERTAALRNIVAGLIQPALNILIQDNVSYPGEAITIKWKARNLSNVRLNFYRLPLTASEASLLQANNRNLLKKGKLIYHTDTAFVAPPAAVWTRFKQTVRPTEPGLYLLQAVSGNVKSECAFFYVSRVGTMWLADLNKHFRIAIVDRRSGKPLPGAKLTCYLRKNEQQKRLNTYTAGPDGVVLLQPETTGYNHLYFAQDGTDAYAPHFLLTSYPYRWTSKEQETMLRVHLYTDRAVYRPGQEIRFGGVAYTQHGDRTEVLRNKNYTVTLRAANGKQLDTLRLCTDSLGTLAGMFRLPASGMNGVYSLSCADHGFATIQVEAYKRPTYTVTLQSPDIPYVLGDTLRIRGEARLFSGVSLQDATVSYTVRHSLRYGFPNRKAEPFTGTAPVAADGSFVLTVPTQVSDNKQQVLKTSWPSEYYEITATVTGADGENEQTHLTVHMSTQLPAPEISWPDRIERSYIQPLRIVSKNASGTAYPSSGTYRITDATDKQILSGTYKSGEAFEVRGLAEIPSGRYRLTVVPDGETDRYTRGNLDFVLFSTKDTRPADTKNPLWFYAPDGTGEFHENPVEILCGTPEKDACIYYNLYKDTHCIESKCYQVSDTVLRFSYAYQPAYGDGITAVFALYRNGRLYQNSYTLRKPAPDKKLKLRWTAFRNRLRPGQQEEWRLQVSRPDGTPVQASVMATLYDAALSKFGQLDWPLYLNFPRRLMGAYWRTNSNEFVGLDGAAPYKPLRVRPLSFSTLDLQHAAVPVLYDMAETKMASGDGAKRMYLSSVSMKNNIAPRTAQLAKEDVAVISEASEEKAAGDTGEVPINTSLLRSNFNETAFFYPQLRTDANGEATLAFTLPESLTSWNLKLMAHSALMDHAMLDTTIVAAKDFMLQGNMPRFLREGDRTELAFTVHNKTVRTLKGRVRCELLDAETEKRIWSGQQSFQTGPDGQQVVTFSVQADGKYPLLICRTIAESDEFSDGEQNYLPVLSNRVELTESIPLTLDGTGTHTFDLNKLYQNSTKLSDVRLTIEYTARPLWSVVQALPALVKPETEDILTLASAYYAASLSEQLLKSSPLIGRMAEYWKRTADSARTQSPLERNAELKQLLADETPWLLQADDEAERCRRLADYFNTDAVDYHVRIYMEKLAALQHENGSWSWFKGMAANDYMTLNVTELLVRLEQMQGKHAMNAPMNRALDYLDQTVLRRVKEMQQAEKRGSKPVVSEWLLRYLWIAVHTDRKPRTDVQKARTYLCRLLVTQQRGGSMYEKALAATVLYRYGEKQAAANRLKSLKEYTVATPGMGRYFDTDRAVASWESYRIPTQVAAIEALRTVDPADKTTREELLKWLLQAKRTQHWGNLRNSVDAVYALLTEKTYKDGFTPVETGRETTFEVSTAKGRILPMETTAQDGTGYFRTTLKETGAKNRPNRLTLTKTDPQPAWGAVYASYTVPVDDVSESLEGLSVACTYYREQNGRWEPLSGRTTLTPGDKVRAIYTLTADRDCDYVCLKAPRPACLEPVRPLSGYDRSAGLGAYRDIKDASANYYFEHFPKGSIRLTIDYRADRKGTYQCGLATWQSVYAPEFTSHTAGKKIEVK